MDKLPIASLEPTRVDRENLSVTVPPHVAGALRTYASGRKVTISSVVSVAIVEYLARSTDLARSTESALSLARTKLRGPRR